VFINEKKTIDHSGGYTPFDVEITELVKAGEDFRLTVAVSNELTNETIPPGKVHTLPDGRKKQTYLHDFFNYSGLARSVWLYSLPVQYVSDATITTDVDWDHSVGLIEYDLELETSPDGDIRADVLVEDEDGVQVDQATGVTGKLRIPNVKLWQPGNAYLYQITTTLRRATDDSVLDTYQIACGVRTVEVKGSQFLINNAPFYFTGFGKHEDTPIRGKGHDPAYMIHDFELLHWLGANSFRTSHYPYAEEVLEYADRQGIVIIDETAAVGLNLWTLRWQSTKHILARCV
jgi:beta-glucuronidase